MSAELVQKELWPNADFSIKPRKGWTVKVKLSPQGKHRVEVTKEPLKKK